MSRSVAAHMHTKIAPPEEFDIEIDPPPQIDPKRRKCLRCTEPFESQWAGERVCGKCKRSSSWRSGEPTSPSSK